MRAHLYVARMDLISSRNVWVCIGRQFNMNAEFTQYGMVCIQHTGFSCLPLRMHIRQLCICTNRIELHSLDLSVCIAKDMEHVIIGMVCCTSTLMELFTDTF
jgi:hypothetical protein